MDRWMDGWMGASIYGRDEENRKRVSLSACLSKQENRLKLSFMSLPNLSSESESGQGGGDESDHGGNTAESELGLNGVNGLSGVNGLNGGKGKGDAGTSLVATDEGNARDVLSTDLGVEFGVEVLEELRAEEDFLSGSRDKLLDVESARRVVDLGDQLVNGDGENGF